MSNTKFDKSNVQSPLKLWKIEHKHANFPVRGAVPP